MDCYACKAIAFITWFFRFASHKLVYEYLGAISYNFSCDYVLIRSAISGLITIRRGGKFRGSSLPWTIDQGPNGMNFSPLLLLMLQSLVQKGPIWDVLRSKVLSPTSTTEPFTVLEIAAGSGGESFKAAFTKTPHSRQHVLTLWHFAIP
jgi:hypothetical protein